MVSSHLFKILVTAFFPLANLYATLGPEGWKWQVTYIDTTRTTKTVEYLFKDLNIVITPESYTDEYYNPDQKSVYLSLLRITNR